MTRFNSFPALLTEKSDLDNLYENCKVDHAVESISRWGMRLLRMSGKILAELGLAISQMCPNLLRAPRTFLKPPRPSRQVVVGILYRDYKWREHFFVFKINQASMGSLDILWIPREWVEDESLSMTDDLCGLIEVIRRGRPHWLSFNNNRLRAALALPRGEGRALPVRGHNNSSSNRALVASRAIPPVESVSTNQLSIRMSRWETFRTTNSTRGKEVMVNSSLVSISDSQE
ncbi:hypothetical protein F2Q69_00013171 [Brassica cretica]|uniref:Uncharacterized protein n=1 Tax=Brassica cretica TaxID=69181 RepID=A0A8S9QZN7_BRACR|nr:hypothetical protein F2Q69_00013171 [Brassica cretica]